MNFGIVFSVSAEQKKKGSWNFDRNFIECVDRFGSVAILTELSFPFHDNGMSFH